MSEELFIYGPCSVESYEQMHKILSLKLTPHPWIRGGSFKLRTSQESFQGLGFETFNIISKLKKSYDFKFVSEITSIDQIEAFAKYVDVIMIGTRNMYNYPLLKKVNELKKMVILKRAFSATLDEWLKAAKYISNCQVILCERGIRTFNTNTRNTLDIGSAVWIKQNTDYKIITDPSHASGDKKLVTPLSLASIAAGLDGVIVETHPCPSKALSDGHQALDLNEIRSLYDKIQRIHHG